MPDLTFQQFLHDLGPKEATEHQKRVMDTLDAGAKFVYQPLWVSVHQEGRESFGRVIGKNEVLSEIKSGAEGFFFTHVTRPQSIC